MEERLRANGLYLAKVKYQIDRNPETEEVNIHFEIDSGKRARFDGVLLSGNFTKSAAAVIRDTRWRRGFGPLRLSRMARVHRKPCADRRP